MYVNGQEQGSARIPNALKAGERIGFIVRTADEGHVTVFFDNVEMK